MSVGISRVVLRAGSDSRALEDDVSADDELDSFSEDVSRTVEVGLVRTGPGALVVC